MFISTNHKPTIYRNVYVNTGPVILNYFNHLIDSEERWLAIPISELSST